MLNYTGQPTMPSSIPGISSPLPSRVQPVIHPGAPLAMQPPPPMLPPSLASAINLPKTPEPGNEPPMIPAPPSEHPGDHNWLIEPQSDGTLLLRIKQPNGSPGPIVKIISGVKVPGSEGA